MSVPKINKLVTLIFSRNRALQIRATIESLLLHCEDVGVMDIVVLYTTSDQRYEDQYQKLVRMFPEIDFLKETSFSRQTIDAMKQYEYVLFSVDDTITVKDFKMCTVMSSLDQHSNSIGFQLRLGRNTTYCYMGNRVQKLPFRTSQADKEVLKYKWREAELDFGYPLEVSSSVYRTKDLISLIQRGWKGRPFEKILHPGQLEGNMSAQRNELRHLQYLLCYNQSVAFANPLNIVRPEKSNRSGGDPKYTVEALAKHFDRNERIKIEEYSGFVPNGAHQEVDLIFMEGE